MKNILTGFCGLFAFLLLLSGCNEEYATYEGPNFISFSDTIYVLPVENNEQYFDIPVVATQATDYDRTLAVEVDVRKTNAVETRDFQLESNTITIPAGELKTNVRIKGYASNIGVEDSLGLNLRLVDVENDYSFQNLSTNVILRKVCPFDISMFEGWCVLTSSYMKDYMPGVTSRLVRSEIVPDEENTIVFRDYFYEGYDVKVKLHTEDPLNPIVTMEEQDFGPTAEAFGAIYGDGIIRMAHLQDYASYYSTCEDFLVHFVALHVPGVGVVGYYGNVVEWISDEEAERIQREGF